MMLPCCPRCTQLLPTDAVFCRRCGSETGFVPPPPGLAKKKGMPILTPILAALLVAGLVVAGGVFISVPQAQSIQPASSNYQTIVPVLPGYTESMNSVIRQYDPVIVTPAYPNHTNAPVHHSESKR